MAELELESRQSVSHCVMLLSSYSQGTKPAAHQEDICMPESIQI